MAKLLKRTKYLILSGLISLTLVNCDKDKSDESAATEAKLVGTWTIASSNAELKINGIPIIDFIKEAFNYTEEQANLFFDQMLLEFSDELEITGTVEFKSDNTYIMNSDGEIETGTWELQSGGKEIVLDKGTDVELIMTVKEASSTNLVIKFAPPVDESEESYDFDQDGKSDTMNAILELTLTKS